MKITAREWLCTSTIPNLHYALSVLLGFNTELSSINLNQTISHILNWATVYLREQTGHNNKSELESSDRQ